MISPESGKIMWDYHQKATGLNSLGAIQAAWKQAIFRIMQNEGYSIEMQDIDPEENYGSVFGFAGFLARLNSDIPQTKIKQFYCRTLQ